MATETVQSKAQIHAAIAKQMRKHPVTKVAPLRDLPGDKVVALKALLTEILGELSENEDIIAIEVGKMRRVKGAIELSPAIGFVGGLIEESKRLEQSVNRLRNAIALLA